MASAIEDITDCPVCWNTFEQPLALICNHTVCKKCATKIRKHQQVKCPKCNQISHESQIKPDFRLAQFLDALTQQAKELTDPHDETEEAIPVTARCELCGAKMVTCICEDCEQNMCGDCKVIHKRSKASMEHRVVPIHNRAEEMKKKLSGLLDHLTNLKATHENILQQGATAEETVETVKKESFQEIDTLCSTLIEEINQLSETLKTEVSDTLNTSLDKVNATKQQAMVNLDTINAKTEHITALLEAENVELATSGLDDIQELDDVVKNIREIEKVPPIPDIQIQKLPNFQVAKGITMVTPTNRTTLSIASEQYDRLLKEKSQRRHSDPVFQVPKDASSGKLDPMLQKKWTRQQITSMTSQHHSSSVYTHSMRLVKKHLYGKPTSKDLQSIRVINGQIYICAKDAVRVFDPDMTHQRDIPFSATSDVAPYEGDKLLVASEGGLFSVDTSGQKTHMLRGKCHKLQVSGAKVYISTGHDSSVYMFEPENNVLQKKKTYTTPHERQKITFAVSSESITICAYDFMENFRIYEMSLEGELLKLHKHLIRTSFLIEYPILCERLEDETILIIVNGRLKLIDTSRQLKSIEMEPKPKNCVHAVKLNDKLYVIDEHSCNTYS